MALEITRGQYLPIVRSFRATDADAVTAISQESPESAHWSRESYVKLAEEIGSLTLVAQTDGKVTAFLVGRLVAGEAEVYDLAVKLDHRRTGLGAALMAAALAEFQSQGVRDVYLEVRESNTPAIAFYESCGFAKTGTRKGYYRQPEEGAITLVRKLTG